MAAFLNVCRFTPTAGSTTDWTYSAAVTGYQSPTAATVVNGRLYKYRAESADLSQWEVGEGAYNTGTGVLARTTVLFNSSGGTSKINFSVAPQVAIVALKEDLLSIEEANTFTTAQKKQAQSNIFVARTIQSFLSGSGTYTTPTGCLWIKVRMGGAGGGGGGNGSGGGGGTGGTGGNTTFSTLTANGGTGGSLNGVATAAAGGTATGGDVNIQGAYGGGSHTIGGVFPGVNGASSPFGGGGPGGGYTAAANGGISALANSCAGGGGAAGVSASFNPGGGGAAGGYLEKTINSPAATYSYAVGAAGAQGTAGAAGAAGGFGGSGIIIVEEGYGS